MNCKLSIIVPVYNVVQYLRHCLQSLTEQGLQDYEVILVNDGSRDNSLGICSEWCQSNPYFRIVNHTENKGLSEARNTGIREAKGEFITFVDSDDFLAPNTLSEVLNAFDEDTDVVEYPVMEYHYSKHPNHLTFTPNKLNFPEWLKKGGHEHCYACNKIFRTALWKSKDSELEVSFPPKRHYEDIFTIPYILQKARQIRQTNQGMYYYCERPGSISHTLAPQTLLDYTNALDELLQLPENKYNYRLRLRARNAERSYHKVSHTTNHIVHPRHLPITFCLASGLSLHDRLKAIYYTCF